jgi:hypothetical protein
MTDLPVNIDTTYADDGGDASVQEHQSHHDTLHGLFNAIDGATPDPSSLGLAAAGTYPATTSQAGRLTRMLGNLSTRRWTIRTSAADNGWLSVVWSAEVGLFVAVANTGVGNRVMTSRRLAEA